MTPPSGRAPTGHPAVLAGLLAGNGVRSLEPSKKQRSDDAAERRLSSHAEGVASGKRHLNEGGVQPPGHQPVGEHLVADDDHG